MKFINTKLLERDDDWNVVSSKPVKVLAWDRDKYFLYENEQGDRATTKGFHLNLKWSNQLHYLPVIDWFVSDDEHGFIPMSRKESQKEIKQGYKRKVKYSVGDKVFKSLRKALNYINSGNAEGDYLHYRISSKRSWQCGPILVLEDGEWCYCGRMPKGVSMKTIKNY